MSVPSSAYHTEKTNFDSTTTEIDVYIAKLLQNTTPTSGDEWGDGYFNSGDTDEVKKSKILDIFKIDGLLRFGTSEKSGFVGFVKELPTPSANYEYHAAGRRSGRYYSDGSNTYVLLNDGSLNRRAHAELGNNSAEPKWANWVNLAYYIRSAFYAASTNMGYSYRINSGTWTDVSFGYAALSAKEILTAVFRQIDLTPTASEGDTIGLRVWVTNPEGTIYSPEYSFTALELLAMPSGSNIYSAPDGNVIGAPTVYMLATTEPGLLDVTTTDANTGLYLYKSEYFTTANPSAGDIVDDGWYVIGSVPHLPNGNVRVFQIVSGQVRKYTERVLTVATIVFRLANVGDIFFPQYRAQATISDDSNPPTGFLQTVSTSVTVNYMDSSNNVLESYSANITVTQGNTSALSTAVSPPPSGASKVQVVCAASAATLGMPKSELITDIPQ